MVIFNTVRGVTDDDNKITIDYIAMAPELLAQRTKIDLTYDKLADTLALKVDRGIFKLKNVYDLLLECR